jgi:hypothetical protein
VERISGLQGGGRQHVSCGREGEFWERKDICHILKIRIIICCKFRVGEQTVKIVANSLHLCL